MYWFVCSLLHDYCIYSVKIMTKENTIQIFNHIPRETPTLVCNPKMKRWYRITIIRKDNSNLYCLYHVQATVLWASCLLL